MESNPCAIKTMTTADYIALMKLTSTSPPKQKETVPKQKKTPKQKITEFRLETF